MNSKEKLKKVIEEYFNYDKVIDVGTYGSGLINKTYLVKFEETSYILQKVNDYVFSSPIGVMYNIDLITNHIRKKVIYEGKNYRNSTLTLIKTKHDQNFAIIDNEYWRCYTCIEGISYDVTDNTDVFYEAGKVVGEFQQLLNDFNPSLLTDNIKDFHNTIKRFQNLEQSIKLDSVKRKNKCLKEIEFARKRINMASIITNAINEGVIPKRVVHNDTKLNNIMFNKKTNKAMCLIDLDTVMNGSILYDYGDALRLGASTSKEDEVDLEKVNINYDMVYAFTKGFLESTKNLITNNEIKLLITGYYTISYELGLRFLTDYLEGDKYFTLSSEEQITRPNLNLERTRNQFKLVSEIEENLDKLEDIIKQVLKEIGK